MRTRGFTYLHDCYILYHKRWDFFTVEHDYVIIILGRDVRVET